MVIRMNRKTEINVVILHIPYARDRGASVTRFWLLLLGVLLLPLASDGAAKKPAAAKADGPVYTPDGACGRSLGKANRFGIAMK